MKWIATFVLMAQMLVWPGAALSQSPSAYRSVSTVSWVEEWDPATRSWVRIEEERRSVHAPSEKAIPYREANRHRDEGTLLTARGYETARFNTLSAQPTFQRPIARYGPFLVLDSKRAAMVGSTGSATPRQFDAMLRDYPELSTFEMGEAPGTSYVIANLEVVLRIRAAGLSTYVPRGGSVRSGAVELFLAGKERAIAPGAQFAVHAWLDNYGREPGDFAPDDPANRLYLDYYREMGMSAARARAIYAMTNSVPHASALWLRAEEMRRWIAPEIAALPPTIAAEPLELPLVPLALGALETPPVIDYGFVGAVSLANLRAAEAHAFLDS